MESLALSPPNQDSISDSIIVAASPRARMLDIRSVMTRQGWGALLRPSA